MWTEVYKKNPAYGRHQFSQCVRILGSMPLPRGFLAQKKEEEKIRITKEEEKNGMMTNERTGSDHVIWGPMRGLKQNMFYLYIWIKNTIEEKSTKRYQGEKIQGQIGNTFVNNMELFENG